MPRPRSGRLARVLTGTLAATVILSMWRYSEHRRAVAVRPSGVSTARDFTRRFGEPQVTHAITVSGTGYYELTFDPGRFGIELPSGPAVYIFDHSGRLTDWTADSGEDPAFRQRWRAEQRRQIDVRSVPLPTQADSPSA